MLVMYFCMYYTLQGFLGWYMVKSGLEDKPDPSDVPRVSQYRLATHLGAAFVLYTLFLWQGLNHLLTPIKVVHIEQMTCSCLVKPV